jgi:hypothetical protein
VRDDRIGGHRRWLRRLLFLDESRGQVELDWKLDVTASESGVNPDHDQADPAGQILDRKRVGRGWEASAGAARYGLPVPIRAA